MWGTPDTPTRITEFVAFRGAWTYGKRDREPTLLEERRKVGRKPWVCSRSRRGETIEDQGTVLSERGRRQKGVLKHKENTFKITKYSNLTLWKIPPYTVQSLV